MATKRKITDEQIAEAQRLQKRGLSLAEIEAKTGIPKPTLAEALRVAAGQPRRAKPRVRTSKAASTKGAPSKLPPTSPAAPALPQGGLAERPDLLALVRRILDARNAKARVELDEGLVVATQGEAELAAWLARPLQPAEIDTDPMVSLREGLALGVAALRAAEPGPETARALATVERLATRLERVMRGRPKPETADEREARHRVVADGVLRKIRGRLPELLAARAAA